MQNLLELKGISRRVSDRFSLRDVTLAVEPGQIVGFVGANGAGKTTTIRAALGLIKLDAGEVHLFGQRCGADAPDETQRHLRSRVGLVLDTCPFPSTLKVGQIESLVGPAYPTWDRETFAGFINRFGLDPKTKVKDLSRGMGMKLQLACALSHNAKLLVLDEATAGLDPVVRDELIDLLLDFVRDENHAILISSHIVSDLEKLCDTIAFLHKGKLLLCEDKDTLREEYALWHGTAGQLEELDKNAIVSRRVTAYGAEALVKRELVPAGSTLTPVSIEELFVLMVKGENVR